MSDIVSEKIFSPLRISHPCTCQKSEKFLHVHDNAFECMLFISGTVEYFIENSIYSLKTGDMTLISPGVIHGFMVGSDFAYDRIPIHIHQHLLRTLSTDETDLTAAFRHTGESRQVIHLKRQQYEQFINYADTIIDLDRQKPYGYDVLKRANLQLLLTLVNSACMTTSRYMAEEVSPEVIKRAIDYISIHLSENISVQEIADGLNISSSRLSHLFKEYTGSSVWSYVVARRLLLSRSLLLEGKSVIEACYESGFRDYAHFNKAFSKTFKLTPGKYKKKMNESGTEWDDEEGTTASLINLTRIL